MKAYIVLQQSLKVKLNKMEQYIDVWQCAQCLTTSTFKVQNILYVSKLQVGYITNS